MSQLVFPNMFSWCYIVLLSFPCTHFMCVIFSSSKPDLIAKPSKSASGHVSSQKKQQQKITPRLISFLLWLILFSLYSYFFSSSSFFFSLTFLQAIISLILKSHVRQKDVRVLLWYFLFLKILPYCIFFFN